MSVLIQIRNAVLCVGWCHIRTAISWAVFGKSEFGTALTFVIPKKHNWLFFIHPLVTWEVDFVSFRCGHHKFGTEPLLQNKPNHAWLGLQFSYEQRSNTLWATYCRCVYLLIQNAIVSVSYLENTVLLVDNMWIWQGDTNVSTLMKHFLNDPWAFYLKVYLKRRVFSLKWT